MVGGERSERTRVKELALYLRIVFRTSQERQLVSCGEVCSDLLHLAKAFPLSPFRSPVLEPHLQRKEKVQISQKPPATLEVFFSFFLSVSTRNLYFHPGRSVQSEEPKLLTAAFPSNLKEILFYRYKSKFPFEMGKRPSCG